MDHIEDDVGVHEGNSNPSTITNVIDERIAGSEENENDESMGHSLIHQFMSPMGVINGHDCHGAFREGQYFWIDGSADVCYASLQQVRLQHLQSIDRLRYITQFASSCRLPLFTNHSTRSSSNQNRVGNLIPSLPHT